MVDILIRKRILKIQERLGMRIGIAYGTKALPVVKNLSQTIEALRELYKIGLKAFVLPPELFADIVSHSDLYKSKYGDLLKIKDEAKRYNIELALRMPPISGEPDEAIRIYTKITSIMDARTVSIRPNFYSNFMPHDQALKLAVYKINEIIASENPRIKIGIETVGKAGDVGSLEDVIDIVKRTNSTEPIINFGMIHAHDSGFLRTRRDFNFVLEKLRKSIGSVYFQNAYFFFSGVRYNSGGYVETIQLSKADINLENMIRETMAAGVKGTLIFEDPMKEKMVLGILDGLADMVR